MSTQGTMRIGEVHAILRRDVPDIELSKIRYYEDKGLVQPTRSRKGYRLYSQRDVDCLREAIRLANEEFVPLRVVRLRLIEQGLLDDAPVSAGTRQVARATSNVISVPVPVNEPAEDVIEIDVVTRVSAATHETTSASGDNDSDVEDAPEVSATVSVTVTDITPVPSSRPVLEGSASDVEPPVHVETRHPSASVSPVREDFEDWDDDRFYSPAEFLTLSGLDAKVMDQLVASGLLSPTTVANQSTFSELDVRVARAIKVLLARDIDVRLLGSLRRNVEREIGLLNDVIQPARPSKKAVSALEARDHARSVALEIAALRAELFARALHRYLGS